MHLTNTAKLKVTIEGNEQTTKDLTYVENGKECKCSLRFQFNKLENILRMLKNDSLCIFIESQIVML